MAATMAWAPPAAADDVRISFKCVAQAGPTPTPEPNTIQGDRLCTPAKGQAIDATWKIAFNVKAGDVGRLRRVKLFIVSQDPDVPSPGSTGSSSSQPTPVAVWGDQGTQANWTSVAQSPNSADLQFDWDTRVLTPYNAQYTIRVEALSHSDQASEFSTGERVDVAVDNAPAKPRPPLTQVKEGGRISLKWAPAPEPDVLWYSVYRARTRDEETTPVFGEFERIAQDVQTTSYTDTVTTSGAYWYSIEVARTSTVARNGYRTARSDRTAEAAVYEAPPPTPTPREGTVTPAPTPPPPRLPTIVQKPLPVQKPPPVPDAPFSAVLPYSTIPPVEIEQEDEIITPRPQAIAEPERDVGRPRGVIPVAVGAFLVSAALTLMRVPA